MPVKVIVISDMEGVAGIVKWEQTSGGDPMYEEGRRLYTEEINAAVRGARAGGATEIVVMDCHGAGEAWTFNSLIPELLDPGCELVVQEHWTEYTEFLEQGCDAALFVGMHAMAGAERGVLNHTVSASLAQPLVQRDARRRDRHQRGALRPLGLPRAARDRRRGDLRRGARAARRRADHGRGQARARPVQRAPGGPAARAGADRGRRPRRSRRSDSRRAVRSRPPCEIRVELTATSATDEYRRKPGVEIVDSRQIVSRADDWWSAWQQFFF